MSTTPTTPETLDSLDQKVHDHREQLIALMAGASTCDDISSAQTWIPRPPDADQADQRF